jgi:hypothetical protein
MPRDDLIQDRRGTAAAWTSANPVLEVGEEGFEIDTFRGKTGDGTTAWNALPYTSGPMGTAAAKDVPASGDAAADEVVLGADSRLGAGGSGAAVDVTYDNTTSGLTADDVQAALDELAASSGGGAVGTPPTIVTNVQFHENYKNAVTTTVDLSASAIYGDVAVIAAWRQSGSWVTPTGWTLLASDAISSSLPKVFARSIIDPSDAVAVLSGANSDPNWGGGFAVLLRGTSMDKITASAGTRTGSGNIVLAGLDTTAACRDLVFGMYAGSPNVAAVAVPSGYTSLDHYEWVYPDNGGIYEAGRAAQLTDAAADTLPAATVVLQNTGGAMRVVAEYAPLPDLPAIDIGEGIVVVRHGATAGTARPSGVSVVYWIGSVVPTNAIDEDLFFDTSA